MSVNEPRSDKLSDSSQLAFSLKYLSLAAAIRLTAGGEAIDEFYRSLPIRSFMLVGGLNEAAVPRTGRKRKTHCHALLAICASGWSAMVVKVPERSLKPIVDLLMDIGGDWQRRSDSRAQGGNLRSAYPPLGESPDKITCVALSSNVFGANFAIEGARQKVLNLTNQLTQAHRE